MAHFIPLSHILSGELNPWENRWRSGAAMRSALILGRGLRRETVAF